MGKRSGFIQGSISKRKSGLCDKQSCFRKSWVGWLAKPHAFQKITFIKHDLKDQPNEGLLMSHPIEEFCKRLSIFLCDLERTTVNFSLFWLLVTTCSIEEEGFSSSSTISPQWFVLIQISFSTIPHFQISLIGTQCPEGRVSSTSCIDTPKGDSRCMDPSHESSLIERFSPDTWTTPSSIWMIDLSYSPVALWITAFWSWSIKIWVSSTKTLLSKEIGSTRDTWSTSPNYALGSS